MGTISQFFKLNRAISARLKTWFPSAFGNPSPSYKQRFVDEITAVISACKPQFILEAGGVDRPALPKTRDYTYHGLDIDHRPGCEHLYDAFHIASIEEVLPQSYDMIISFTLLEHVPDNTKSIQAIFQSLPEGGSTHHYVPSKYHPYSLGLRLMGPNLQKKLIPALRPGAEKVSGYPAYFNLCSPDQMKNALTAAGFRRVEIYPYYRANEYFASFVPAYVLVTFFENICSRLSLAVFSSGFVISAYK